MFGGQVGVAPGLDGIDELGASHDVAVQLLGPGFGRFVPAAETAEEPELLEAATESQQILDGGALFGLFSV